MDRLLSVVGVVLTGWVFSTAIHAGEPWEYTPYEIRVWLAVCPSAALPSSLRESVLREVDVQAQVYGEAAWRLQTQPAPEAIGPSIVAAIDDLAVEQIVAASQDALTADKIFLLGLRESQGRFELACREFDCRTRTLSTTVRETAWQARYLTRVAANIVLDTFQPFVRVESSRGKSAVVRVRAGGLMSKERSPSAVQTGDVLLPVIRRNDRNGAPKPNGIQVLDRTFLLARQSQEYFLECDVYSASRNPLVGRGSSTVDRVAIRIRPQGSHTVLQLLERDSEMTPLKGYEIWSRKPLADGDKQDNPSVRLGWTDWRGMIDITQADLPLRLIYVKNGSHLLARIPVVPGFKPNESVPLGSDDKRLEAEAFVKGMESIVMDLVARRQILASRIRRRVAEGKRDDAKSLLDEYKALQTKEDLEKMLAGRESELMSRDRIEQQRIEKLLAGTRTLLNKYLHTAEVVALEREIGGAQTPPPAKTATPEN